MLGVLLPGGLVPLGRVESVAGVTGWIDCAVRHVLEGQSGVVGMGARVCNEEGWQLPQR